MTWEPPPARKLGMLESQLATLASNPGKWGVIARYCNEHSARGGKHKAKRLASRLGYRIELHADARGVLRGRYIHAKGSK